ncbi:flagellar biosynthesis protein FlhF [Bacillus alkalicellulosilyticus]|uniref:flagellar biosynthesis protein FlhF n=1 Tax=Alkalihalobacterium alkalicellulosilyticum TaxID=1912214 RepID=UPI000997D768|nr:flagellar biosynthesis protein FlhF [Bacillus alkalicellulosilyticus]
MKVKKFTAKTMPEAMKVIRSELGHDAVILNSKEVETGGFLGFFTRKNIEVIAAVDSVPTVKVPPRKEPPRREVPLKEIPKVRQQSDKATTPIVAPQVQSDLVNELKQLKQMVTSISNQQETKGKEYPEPFQQIDDLLEEQDVAERFRLEAMKHLLEKWYTSDKQKNTEELIHDDLYQYLQSRMTVPMGGIQYDKKYINIVGPTGVGKTTTIAKIAAHCLLKQQKKVALITTDTYRIAAVEQLKTYSKILNIPLEVAYSIEDFKKAKEQFANYDLVLVDSAGRNFRNPLYIEELKKVIDFNDEVETYLVLALTSKFKDMKAIYEQFQLITIEKLIFTKMDETSYYGAMLNMILQYGVGVAYITTGQNVPDDIIEATDSTVINAVLEGKSYE